MKKVNLREVQLEDIHGNPMPGDFHEVLGNQLYMQGKDIAECELGRDIWHKGEVELNDQQVAIVKAAVAGYTYIAREAIESVLASKP
jgi:hypothetical protein